MAIENTRPPPSDANREGGHTAHEQEERRIRRYNRVLRGINRVFEQVIRAETEELLGDTCLAVAVEVTGSQIGFVGEVEADGLLHDIAISEMGWAACRMVDPTGHRRPPGNFVLHGLYGRVINDGKSLLTNDPPSHPDSIGVPPGHPPLTSFLGVPLVHEGKTIGLLAVANRKGGYSREQQEDLEALAPAVVEALLRKRAEQALRASEERLRFVATNIPDILFFQDLDLRYVWIFNPADPLEESQVTGKTDADLLPPQEAGRLTEIKRKVLETGTGTKVELQLSPGGITRWYEAVYEPWRDADGQIVGVVSYSRDITDRKRAEEQLREALAKAAQGDRMLSALMEYVPEGITMADAALNLTRVSRYGQQRLGGPYEGKSTADVVAQWQVYHADGVTPMAFEDLPLVRAVQHGEVVQDAEVVQVNARGERLPLLCTAGPIRDVAGNVVGGTIAWRDITERKRAEEALRQSDEKAHWLARFPEENPNPVLRVSVDGTVLYRNPAAAATSGWQCEVAQPLPHEVLRRLIGQAIADGRVFEQEVVLGSTSFSVAVAPVKGEGYANIYARDITDRKQAEETLRQSEARRKVAEAVEVERRRFNDMLDILPAYVVLLSPDHHVPFANRFFRERFGESHGQRCYEYLFGRTEPCEVCESYTALRTNAPHRWEWTGPDGRLYDVYDFPFTDTDGSALIMEMGIDITERKQAEEALIQAERLGIMGRMTASLAHEVNNPIQSVVGCLGLAQELLEEGKDATQFIAVALEESERAARIVHRMRDLGHSEAVHTEPATVGELIEKVLILTHNQARNQHVKATWEKTEELPPVPMVRDRIQQVFLNLVLNAIDAMPEGGELHIGAARTREPSGVQVSFADTGVGMSPEEVARLFEAFHSTKQLGLGLGLYVSRNILQEHDGWIDVQSKLGEGATFTVWLPADGE